MNKTRLMLTALCLGSLQIAAIAAPPATSAPGAKTPAGTAGQGLGTGTPSNRPAYLSYSYYGDRYRDPFIPLTGDFRTDAAMDRPPHVASLTLKGIVQDPNGRMALLSSGANSYILRGGRLYDGRNKAVKKISGIIKTDSVVIIGADHTVREIRAKQAF